MKLPPNASVGSGQPRVWITRSSGRLRLPELLHPEREDLGVDASDPLATAGQAWDSVPRVPSDEHRDLRRQVGGLLIDFAGWPSRSRPEGVVRTPFTAVALDQQGAGREAGEDVHAQLLGLAPRASVRFRTWTRCRTRDCAWWAASGSGSPPPRSAGGPIPAVTGSGTGNRCPRTRETARERRAG